MNVRRIVCLVAVVAVLGTGLSTWRYLARLQSVGTSVSAPAPTGSLDDKIAKAVNALPYGTIVIDAPAAMRMGDEAPVRAIVSDRVRAAVAKVLVSEKRTAMPLAVSQQMNAQLYGDPDRVKITPLQGDDYVAFGSNHTIEWRWTVKPLAPGNLELHLVATAQLDVPLAGSRSARVHAVTKDVVFEVAMNLPATILAVIEQNWTWLWVAVVVPAAGAIWAWYRSRREKLAGSAANA